MAPLLRQALALQVVSLEVFLPHQVAPLPVAVSVEVPLPLWDRLLQVAALPEWDQGLYLAPHRRKQWMVAGLLDPVKLVNYHPCFLMEDPWWRLQLAGVMWRRFAHLQPP